MPAFWSKRSDRFIPIYAALKVFNDELEKYKRYEHFLDFCETFELVRGKTTNEEEHEIVGEFKV